MHSLAQGISIYKAKSLATLSIQAYKVWNPFSNTGSSGSSSICISGGTSIPAKEELDSATCRTVVGKLSFEGLVSIDETEGAGSRKYGRWARCSGKSTYILQGSKCQLTIWILNRQRKKMYSLKLLRVARMSKSRIGS